jgi:hypothetical protein
MKMSVLIGCLLAGLPRAYAFVPSISSSIGGTPGRLVVAGIDVTADRRTTGHQRQQQLAAAASMEVDEQQSMGIVAPLTYIRGCPIVSLDFGLNTLDFVLSTGSNVNTINPEIVQALQCFETEAPFTEVPVVACGMGAYFDGDSIMLGDASLSSNMATIAPMRLKDIFAVGLALEPAGHGQLGVPFFFRFAAVEFAWHGLADYLPTLALYKQDIPLDSDPALTRIPIERLPAQIALIESTINGRSHQAILATCSPVTILSPAAAAGIPLSDDVFTVNALDGSKQVELRRSLDPVALSIGEDGTFALGESYIYVGDLPGHDEFLAEADMVLGTDFLRNTFRMVLTEDAVYFEPMNGRDPYYEDA